MKKAILLIVIIVSCVSSLWAADAGEPAKIEPLLRAQLDGMKSALSEGDIDRALGYIALPVRQQYREVFTALKEKGLLKTVFGRPETMSCGSIADGFATCTHVVEEDGGKYAYPLTCVLTNDGSWKITSF